MAVFVQCVFHSGECRLEPVPPGTTPEQIIQNLTDRWGTRAAYKPVKDVTPKVDMDMANLEHRLYLATRHTGCTWPHTGFGS